MNSDQVGDIAEAHAIAKCLELQWTVLKPFGKGQPYDIVIDRLDGEGFKRVQVKHARYKEDSGVVVGHTRRLYYKNGTSANVRSYSANDIDFYFYYCSKLGKCYLVPIREVQHCKRECTLRVDKAKYNRKRKDRDYRYANRFEI